MNAATRFAPLLLPALGCAEEGGDTAGKAVACSVEFAATVNSGPSAGTELAGTLRMDIEPSGTLAGDLTAEDGSVTAVVGSAADYSINLAFTLADGSIIYGVGTSDQPVTECSGTFGGPFTGPQEGDAGDWLARSFGIDASTRSYYDA